MDWIDLSENRDGYHALDNVVMKNLASIKCGEFLN